MKFTIPAIASRNEQKLNDLTSQAEFLSQVAGTRPMTWHEFRHTQEVSVPRSWRSLNTLAGAGLGMGAGLLATYFLPFMVGAPMPEPGIVYLSSLGGAGAGALVGQLLPPSDLDKRSAQLDAYEKYLDAFAAGAAIPSRERQVAAGLSPPHVPARETSGVPTFARDAKPRGGWLR